MGSHLFPDLQRKCGRINGRVGLDGWLSWLRTYEDTILLLEASSFAHALQLRPAFVLDHAFHHELLIC